LKIYLLSFALLLLAGCTQESDFSGVQNKPAEFETKLISVTENTTSGVIDIIFLVDSSGSMAQEIPKVEVQLPSFINEFTSDFANIDYRIFIIGTALNTTDVELYPDLSDDDLVKVTTRVFSRDALGIFQEFVNKEHEDVSDKDLFLRENSTKHVIVVSDDDAQEIAHETRPGQTREEFKEFVENTPMLKGKTGVNAIAGVDITAAVDGCRLAREAKAYMELSQTEGLLEGTIADLCTNDWGPLFENMAESIITRSISSSFILDDIDTEVLTVVELDGVRLDPANYNFKNNILKINGSVEIQSGDELKITYRTDL